MNIKSERWQNYTKLEELTINLSNPHVRDLAWVMQSPSLVTSINNEAASSGNIGVISDAFCAQILKKNHRWLQQLDQSPQPLIRFLAARETRKLGIYFEALVCFWLSQRIARGFFESHVKVSANNRDIGEFDFLFRSEKQMEHWETAVKFYLYTKNKDGEINWYGPNASDTLEKKLHRMLAHQLRLSENPEAKSLLRAINQDSVSARMFIKGYLFYPIDAESEAPRQPVSGCEISSSHLAGWWANIESLGQDVLNSFSSKSLRWRILPRLEWLAPRIYDTQQAKESLVSSSRIIELTGQIISRSGRPSLIAGYSLNGSGQWQEESRGFVVGMNWPDSGSPPIPSKV